MDFTDQNIELSNGKFDTAVENSGYSNYFTAILLRLLNDLGSLLYCVKTLFLDDWINTYHLYFFTRLIAVRFDEISDAIYIIDKNFPCEESTVFIELLKTNNIYPLPEDIRVIARKLRNSIHYNSQNEIWDIDLSKSFYWHFNFLKQASVGNSYFSDWPDDFIVLKDKMLACLGGLHALLSEIL